MHCFPDRESWLFAKKSLKRARKSCKTCHGVAWVYCKGKAELNCQNCKLEHIHTCPDCGSL